MVAGVTIHGVHQPHNNAAYQECGTHDNQAFEMLPYGLGKQKGGYSGENKSDQSKGEWMVEDRAVMSLPTGKGGNKIHEATAKEDGECQYGSQLDHDGVHLPVT